MKFQTNFNCNRLHLHVIDPISVSNVCNEVRSIPDAWQNYLIHRYSVDILFLDTGY